VETSYFKTDMYKFELLQKDESRNRSADSTKTYSKFRGFENSSCIL